MYPLGVPLPNSPHAVSVSLPKWADVVGYEEGEPRVIDAMQLGYPRFVYHPKVLELFADCEAKFAGADEFCRVYPSEATCKMSVEYCGAGRVEKFAEGAWAAVLPKGLEARAKEFWQHAGFGVCSRFAESRVADFEIGEAHKVITDKLVELSGADAEDIYLFPSGMAAISTAHRILETQTPQPKTAQLGFSYVDSFKVQEKFGTCEFVQIEDFERLAAVDVDGVFTEYPLNPMLQKVDFTKVRAAIGTTPLVVDDTLCAWQGFNALDVADIAVTSLTKFFSAIGDVMAGCLILNKKSPHYAKFKTRLDGVYEYLLHAVDAGVLAKNCKNFQPRIEKIIENATRLNSFLAMRGKQLETRHHNGMITIIFSTEAQAVKFYDALEVKKGPSLGTEYTLACPYTLLAHYEELDWAESVGVPRHLVRVSVGAEEYAELEKVFGNALHAAE